jgi:hypothetical protein
MPSYIIVAGGVENISVMKFGKERHKQVEILSIKI